MPFEELKKYRLGELWSRFAQVRPEPDEPIPEDLDPIHPPPEPLIYHYTDVVGLKGILETNRLWASAAYYLNDSSEIDYGCGLVIKEVTRQLQYNKGDSFAVRVLDGLQRIFTHPGHRNTLSASIYVACFCENGNLLSQWRAYGQAGGYSLGFEVDENWRTMSLGIAGEFWDSRLARVIYSPSNQLRRISSIFRQAFEAIQEHSPNQDNVAGTDLGRLLANIVEYISELLLDEIVIFKNPAFREENEWRLIVMPNMIRSRNQEAKLEGPAPKLKFRESRGSLVPYLELHPVNDKIPLRSIRYGPSLVKNRVETPLNLLLAECGLNGVRVIGSELPAIL